MVAAEDVGVKRGRVKRIGIEPIDLLPSTISSILSVVRHALGMVLDVRDVRDSMNIDEPKRLEEVYFLPIENGFVKEGDLLGVIKVFILGKEPELRMVENQLSKREIKIAYTNGGIRRTAVKVSEMWYRRWHLAEWIPLISDEDVNVKKGNPILIRISSIEIPGNTIPVPLFIMRNAYGIVLDLHLHGRPKKIEENRTVSEVLFMPVFDGEVQRGDILGVLNVYNVSVGERSKSLMKYLLRSFKGNLVYWKGDEVLRKEFEIKPFHFKRSSMGRIEPVLAAESKELKADNLEVIKIEEIDFPAGTIVQPLIGTNGSGTLLDVFTKGPLKMVEDEKRVDRAVFLPYRDMEIREGDLLGMINVYHVTILYEPETLVLKHGGLFPMR
ncbi:MAG: DUF22 domain-containing protein [Archaeoglobus sp.]|nr:DUF22 domain-containing protein [Archaeoglobus sp.]